MMIDNWHFAVAVTVGGFIAGLGFLKFWQAVCALMEFEYRDARCQEQAKRIQIEYDHVMSMNRDKDTLSQIEQRQRSLGQEFEKLRRECGK